MSGFRLLVLVFIGILFCACSGSTDSGKITWSPNSNSASISNSSQTVSSNADLTDQTANVQTGSFAKSLSKKKMVDEPASGPPPLRFDKAGEDSEIAATMNGSGQMFEVRVFKSHPQIAKVEATWISPKDKTLKIYLRNGQVMDVTTDRIVNLKQAMTGHILALAGIRRTPTAPSTGGKTGAKTVQ